MQTIVKYFTNVASSIDEGFNKTEEFLQKLAPCIERGELEACVGGGGALTWGD